MAKDLSYVVCYDVTEDRERQAVARLLEGYGQRAQRSVFECRLTRAARGRLMRQLQELQLQTGFVYFYPLQPNSSRQEVGNCPTELFPEEAFAFVV